MRYCDRIAMHIYEALPIATNMSIVDIDANDGIGNLIYYESSVTYLRSVYFRTSI